MKPVKLLIPKLSPLGAKYFGGEIQYSRNEILIYVTAFFNNRKLLNLKADQKFNIYGCCDCSQKPSYLKPPRKFKNWLYFHHNPTPNINKLFLNGIEIDTTLSTVIFYDHDVLVNSEVKWEFNDIFSKLQHLVRNDNSDDIKNVSEPFLLCPSWLKSSTLLQHIICYINTLYWALITVKTSKKISIKHGNLLLSIIIDILVGYIVLEFLKQDKKELSVFLMSLLEKLINMLYSLLKWLMGAPAGLKLNNAFNKMLGKYFSYHVQLWWLFFDVTGEKLSLVIDVYNYLGYLGFTFQAAVISDMISIVTFHSFCIYVYAARMFNIQVSGLIALLRFFVGRKYNPLRECIDSCEYNNQELFVGTVAFTILLLLLPTTAMYYIVFTLFRLLTLLVQHALAKLIYHMQTLPLYVTVLWLCRSPKVAGNVLLEVINSPKGVPTLFINLKLFNKSLCYLVKSFCPPCDIPKKLVWSQMLSNIFIGKPIV